MIKALGIGVRDRLTDDYLKSDAGKFPPIEFGHLLHDLPRELDAEPAVKLVEHAMQIFNGRKPESSDSWLAPRLHASLRLYRREAAERDMWTYLAVVEVPEYVRWRWPGNEKGTAVERFVGPSYTQALSRLWWGAELTRNGGAYAPTMAAFRFQDIPNQWMRYDLFHHRPSALAAIRVIAAANGGRGGEHQEVVDLAKAFNHVATTTVLDTVSWNPEPDMTVIEEWTDTKVDETKLYIADPSGPEDSAVDEASILAVQVLIERVARDAGIFTRDKR
jgi:hypothetical protein